MGLFDRGYTRHRSEIFAPQEPAETNISKRRQTQPKVDARPALPPAFYLRRNTRPPTVKRRTCRLIAWGALCRMGLWSLLGNRSPSVKPRPVLQRGQGAERWSAWLSLLSSRHLGFLANCDLTAHKHSAKRNSARTAGGWMRKEGTVGPFLAWRSFVKCAALLFSCRHGQKSTRTCKNQHIDKLQFEIPAE